MHSCLGLDSVLPRLDLGLDVLLIFQSLALDSLWPWPWFGLKPSKSWSRLNLDALLSWSWLGLGSCGFNFPTGLRGSYSDCGGWSLTVNIVSNNSASSSLRAVVRVCVALICSSCFTDVPEKQARICQLFEFILYVLDWNLVMHFSTLL